MCPNDAHIMRNDKHIFIAGTDRRLHAIVADEYWEAFAVTADNDSMINSLVVDNDFVVFSTDAGNVICTSSQSRDKHWQRDIAVGITVEGANILNFQLV